MTRRTKIVATIGPVSSSPDVLAGLMDAGMDVARIALAHTPLDEALDHHARIREVSSAVGHTVATMVDLPGPLIRTGRAALGGVTLRVGDEITLAQGDGTFEDNHILIDYDGLAHDVSPEERLNLGESVEAVVDSVDDGLVHARVTSGGSLNGRSAVKLPSLCRDRAAFTQDDRAALAAFVDAGVDIVALSAHHGDDLAQLALPAPPNGPLLLAKIESMEAVGNLDTLIGNASGIIIGRGGLGLEAKLEDLPHIQKSVIQQCIALGLPVVTASQMLDSMITAPVPTRAETTDITNAIIDGTSALMLSAETAIGDHPVATVATMHRIASRADEQFDHTAWAQRVAALRMAAHDADTTITDAMTIGAARTAEELGLRTLLCISASGFTVRSMARFRPEAQLVGVSAHNSTVRQLALSWGVTPVHALDTTYGYSGKVDQAIKAAAELGLVESGELVGVIAGITSQSRATDTFRIVTVP